MAARKEIDRYTARWFWNKHYGRIGLREADGTWVGFQVDDPGEFGVIVDLLRNEKPIYHGEAEGSHIGTYNEDVGEEET